MTARHDGVYSLTPHFIGQARRVAELLDAGYSNRQIAVRLGVSPPRISQIRVRLSDVEAYLGAQQEWMANNLPKRGAIVEAGQWGEAKLPPKAERVYGKPGKSDHTAMYLDREGKVQTVAYRMPEAKKAKGKGTASEDTGGTQVTAKSRPDVTRKGIEMIGDFRTDALHEALARAAIEEDTLMALLVLAFAGRNVSVDSGSSDTVYGHARLERHAALLFGEGGRLDYDRETLHQTARKVLIEVLSCRENRSNSGILARVAGDTIGADGFLPNMGTDEFMSCLSRPALEASCKDTPVLPRARVKDTRAALAEHFKEGHFVHPSALFAPDVAELTNWAARHAALGEDDEDTAPEVDEIGGDQTEGSAHDHPVDDGHTVEDTEAWRVAAE